MKIEFLIIHCTATPEGINVTGKDIRHWHTDPKPNGNGWKQVGYRSLIKEFGVEKLVDDNGDENIDPWEVTNGAYGYNQKAVHICYVGGQDKQRKAKDTRTVIQKKFMENIVKEYIKKFPWIKIGGHYQINDTECPAFDVLKWLREIGVNEQNMIL